jgi:hypothetical protein
MRRHCRLQRVHAADQRRQQRICHVRRARRGHRVQRHVLVALRQQGAGDGGGGSRSLRDSRADRGVSMPGDGAGEAARRRGAAAAAAADARRRRAAAAGLGGFSTALRARDAQGEARQPRGGCCCCVRRGAGVALGAQRRRRVAQRLRRASRAACSSRRSAASPAATRASSAAVAAAAAGA